MVVKGQKSSRRSKDTSTYREAPSERTDDETFQIMSERPAFSNISNLYSSTQTAQTQKNFIKENRRQFSKETVKPNVDSSRTTLQTAGFNFSGQQSSRL